MGMLGSLPGTAARKVDFAQLPLQQQMAIVSRTDILIGGSPPHSCLICPVIIMRRSLLPRQA